AIEVIRKPRHAAPEQQSVAVAVQTDLMSRRGDLRRQRRPPLHLLADEVERGDRAGVGERSERGGSALWMGAVVERQRHPGGSLEAARDAEPWRQARQEGQGRRP
ncbi:MAG: hypothetical protein QOH15_2114, partial [Gaiellales bacterium]|nr:hypothetical protein [Gaiellales bacterium]